MKKETIPKILRPFNWHCSDFSLHRTEGDDQLRMTCPFCNHEKSKFYLNKTNGTWDCKHCGLEGNIYTFLREIQNLYAEDTKLKQFSTLSKKLNIPVSALTSWELVWDSDHREWLCPVENEKGTVLTFRRWLPKEKYKPKAAAGLALQLYGLRRLRFPMKRILLCEGEKDAIILSYHLAKSELSENDTCVLAVPGVDQFKPQWIEIFKGKEVYILYDNDDAGKDGTKKVIENIKRYASNIKSIVWPEIKKDKYDIRDLCIELKHKSNRIINWILKHSKPINEIPELSKVEGVAATIMIPCSPTEILAWPTPTTQVEDLFLPSAFVLCAGEAKSGKTTLTADMLCAIQCGVPWQIGEQKLKVQQGQIVYITKEGKGGWQARMRALEMRYGHYKGFNDMKWFFDAPMLDTNEGMEFLLRSIDVLDETPTIIAYDNLSRLMTGDENKVQDTAPVIHTLDMVRNRYGCTNFLLHHAGWKETKRPRGSSNLVAAADTVIVIEKKSSKTRQLLISKLSTKMQRDLSPIVPVNIHYRTVEIGIDKYGKKITALSVHFKKTQVEKDGLKMLKILEKQKTSSIDGTLKMGRMAGLSSRKARTGSAWLLRTGKVQRKKIGKHFKWTKINDSVHG